MPVVAAVDWSGARSVGSRAEDFTRESGEGRSLSSSESGAKRSLGIVVVAGCPESPLSDSAVAKDGC